MHLEGLHCTVSVKICTSQYSSVYILWAALSIQEQAGSIGSQLCLCSRNGLHHRATGPTPATPSSEAAVPAAPAKLALPQICVLGLMNFSSPNYVQTPAEAFPVVEHLSCPSPMQVSTGILRGEATLRTNLPILHKSMESDADAG